MTRAATEALEEAGWAPERKRGEPVWWHDPMRLVGPLRTDDAYALMMKRKANGIEQHSRDTQRKDGRDG